MNIRMLAFAAIVLWSVGVLADTQIPEAGESFAYFGMCDASLTLNGHTFVVASDEDNKLRVYDLEKTESNALSVIDISGFFENGSEESDIEGVALLDGKVFWIASHGRNSQGKAKPDRQQLFAMDLQCTDREIRFTLVRDAYRNLLKDLIADNRFQKFDIAGAAKLAPENGGVNIEGLAATADHKLLIGFRSPVREEKALIVRLENPLEIPSGKGGVFGDPFELDLSPAK